MTTVRRHTGRGAPARMCTAAPASRVGCVGRRSARQCWKAETCSGARPVKSDPADERVTRTASGRTAVRVMGTQIARRLSGDSLVSLGSITVKWVDIEAMKVYFRLAEAIFAITVGL